MIDYDTNILAVYNASTIEERDAGRRWYSEANLYCSQLATAYALPLKVVVHVLAALSPGNEWNRNKRDASALIDKVVTGSRRKFASATYPANVAKATAILRSYLKGKTYKGKQWFEILSGPKVRAFELNIEYPSIARFNTITVDLHAYSIANGKRYTASTCPHFKNHADISDAYRRVAYQVGLEPHQLQAITWLTWKRLHAI
jgi:hypothetical protein